MSTWPPQPPPAPPVPLPGRPGHTPWQPDPRPSPGAPTQSTVVNVEADWLADRLLDQRIVSLSGQLTPETANRATASLALLDASGDDPIQLRLLDLRPDPNAELDTVLTLLDAIDLVTVPLHATCLGGLTGTLAVLLAVADRRVAGANAHIVLREPRIDLARRSATDLDTHARPARRQLRTLQHRLAEACGRPVQAVIEDLRTGRVLTAEQARDYGLVDIVTSPHPPSIPG